MSIVKETAYEAVYLCGCALNGIVPDKAGIYKTNPEQLYKFGEFHSLTALICTALESAGIRSKSFVEAKAKAIRKVILLDDERAKIADFMEEKGIWYMPLKGVILKDLYPQIGVRQMSDNDILFDKSYRNEIRQFMESRGYKTEHFGIDTHDVYQKPPIYNYEMHVSLFGIMHDEKLEKYYRSVKDRLISCGGQQFRFSDEDFYIYITAHEYKHYSGGGTGLRSLADRYVYNRAKGEGLDRKYIAAELKKLGIAEFEEQMRLLAEKIFSDPVNFSEKLLSDSEKKQLDFILFSGTYGTLENNVENKLTSLSGEKVTFSAKVKYIWKRFFPAPRVLVTFYPFFGRHKLLLPFGYIYRIFKGIFTNTHKLINELKIIKRQ
jgi:hypothetical protein